MSFISVMRSWIYSIITPVFSVIWFKWSNILICWFAAQETFPNIINIENSSAASYFFQDSWIEISKEKHLFKK